MLLMRPCVRILLLAVLLAVPSSAHAQQPYPTRAVKVIAPFALAASPPYVVVVHPSVPATTIAALIAHAKANPGKVTFGSSGPGTASNSAGLMFAAMTGTNLLAVPYKGIGQAVTDLLGGQ